MGTAGGVFIQAVLGWRKAKVLSSRFALRQSAWARHMYVSTASLHDYCDGLMTADSVDGDRHGHCGLDHQCGVE